MDTPSTRQTRATADADWSCSPTPCTTGDLCGPTGPSCQGGRCEAGELDKLFTLVVEYVVDLEELQMSPAKLADPMELQRF